MPSDNTYPFQMKRRQFPIKLAFGITANKAQGQTLQRVGIYLPTNVFSHGQLYVAMSRATSAKDLKISAVDPTKTENIVYKEVL
jgi:ATP-dependent exoDNAse (exonuclease V) alpha subunit